MHSLERVPGAQADESAVLPEAIETHGKIPSEAWLGGLSREEWPDTNFVKVHLVIKIVAVVVIHR